MKYPRTLHVEGSLGRRKPEQVSLHDLPGDCIIIEEKLDGTQASIHFESRGNMIFESRGNPLTGGQCEDEFNLMKPWAYAHHNALWERLGTRYKMYGEWMYAKHTVFYDALPHYFFEFDVWDHEEKQWLSTVKRSELLQDSPVVSVPILYQGKRTHIQDIQSYVQPSLYKTQHWKEKLRTSATQLALDVQRVEQETEMNTLPEGIYIKSESEHHTLGRYKWIRPDFLRTILDSGTHWKHRSVLPNQMQEGIDLFT